MKVDRRTLLALSSAAPAALGLLARPPAHAAAVAADARADFPWAGREVYLNAALEHPLSVHSSAAMQEYIGHLTHGPDSARAEVENAVLQEGVRANFARLIHARPAEIAFVPSTQMGENLVLDGLGIKPSENVVTNDLHYGGSLFNYRMRRNAGLDVRIVKHRDYQIDFRDLERVVNKKTRLIALALVSNVNGYLHDIKKISDLVHSLGAYVFADVIQAAGAVPINVRAMGIDFLACSAYKWLMGGRFGYLYVAQELQDVMKVVHFGGKGTGKDKEAARYEISTACHLGFACQDKAVPYILKLGVKNIRDHVRPLTERLQKELPAVGYPSITPRGNESPIVTFRVKDPEKTREKLKNAGVIVTLRAGKPEGQMRVSPSIYNNLDDVNRLIEALA